MAWLIAIICIILVIVFWRIFLPIAIIAAVGLGLVFLYVVGESERSERERQVAEQTTLERIAKAKVAAGDVVREWKVLFQTDPASGKKVPRYASVLSDGGLCRLQVEERPVGGQGKEYLRGTRNVTRSHTSAPVHASPAAVGALLVEHIPKRQRYTRRLRKISRCQ